MIERMNDQINVSVISEKQCRCILQPEGLTELHVLLVEKGAFKGPYALLALLERSPVLLLTLLSNILTKEEGGSKHIRKESFIKQKGRSVGRRIGGGKVNGLDKKVRGLRSDQLPPSRMLRKIISFCCCILLTEGERQSNVRAGTIVYSSMMQVR